jgi:ribosomal protein S4
MTTTRLNKHIAETGYCSRREADRLISSRRVTVNGSVAGVAAVVGEDDEVRVDGQPLRARVAAKPGARRHVYIALNKPVGVTCTTESAVKGNIVDFVGHEQRIFPIGRLDKDSEGLILLTSNGDIVNEVLRAENRHQKEYLVAVNKPVTDEFLRGMARGVHPRPDHAAVPHGEDRQVRLPHRAGAGPEPADPPDERGLRLPRHPTAPRAHRQHQAGRAQAGPVAQPHRRRAARPVAAAHGLVSVAVAGHIGRGTLPVTMTVPHLAVGSAA